MEFTTQQLYGIFAALTCAALAGLIFYCIGLRTGRRAGADFAAETAANHWRELLTTQRTISWDLREQLDKRTRELRTCHANLLDEVAQHTKAENDLKRQLGGATLNLVLEVNVLVHMAASLDLAASTFEGIGAHKHASEARRVRATALHWIERVKAEEPHPDSVLIDWLDREATIHYDPETCSLQFQCAPATEAGVDNLRSVLRQAMDHSDRDGGDATDAPIAITDVSLSVDGGKAIGSGTLHIRPLQSGGAA